MSTPLSCGTNALDAMRKSIYDQLSPAISADPDLISEIFLIRTPREIEMILTQFNIDIDDPLSVPPIKRYIEDYGDAYLASPASFPALTLDNLPLTYFALDAMRKSIYDQSSLGISANPDLISEIFLIRTPREIEMILTQLNIDVDASLSVPIKRYIVDYGDAYLASPA